MKLHVEPVYEQGVEKVMKLPVETVDEPGVKKVVKLGTCGDS